MIPRSPTAWGAGRRWGEVFTVWRENSDHPGGRAWPHGHQSKSVGPLTPDVCHVPFSGSYEDTLYQHGSNRERRRRGIQGNPTLGTSKGDLRMETRGGLEPSCAALPGGATGRTGREE